MRFVVKIYLATYNDACDEDTASEDVYFNDRDAAVKFAQTVTKYSGKYVHDVPLTERAILEDNLGLYSRIYFDEPVSHIWAIENVRW